MIPKIIAGHTKPENHTAVSPSSMHVARIFRNSITSSSIGATGRFIASLTRRFITTSEFGIATQTPPAAADNAAFQPKNAEETTVARTSNH